MPFGPAAAAAQGAQQMSLKPPFVVAAGDLPPDLKGLTIYLVFDKLAGAAAR
jgi:hypothetical protein